MAASLFRITQILICFTVTALADVGDRYGFGSRAASQGGAGVSDFSKASGYSAYNNPAGLPRMGNRRLVLEYGFVFMDESFQEIQNVVIENSFNSDKTPGNTRKGDVETDYLATFGQVLGLSIKLFPKFYDLTFGVVVFGPFERSSYLDTGETFLPEYVLYRASTQRPQFEMGFGAALDRNWSIGTGVHVVFSTTTKVNNFLATSPGKASNMRVSGSLRPKPVPYLGGLFQTERFSLGAVFRFPATSTLNVITDSKSEIFSGAGSPDVNFEGESAAVYDPLSVEIGTTWKLQPAHAATLQIDYQAWRIYPAPALRISGASTGIQISNSEAPDATFKDIWVPRVGYAWSSSDRTTFRAGYSYRDSILEGVSDGKGNILDPPSHILTAGAGFDFQEFFGVALPWQLNVHLAYHHLVEQTITKKNGNEAGLSGEESLGGPSYKAGGAIYGGGMSLALAF